MDFGDASVENIVILVIHLKASSYVHPVSTPGEWLVLSNVILSSECCYLCQI